MNFLSRALRRAAAPGCRPPASIISWAARSRAGRPNLRFHPGEVKETWAREGGVDLVVLQAWAQARNRIRAVDTASNIVSLAGDALPNASRARRAFLHRERPGGLAARPMASGGADGPCHLLARSGRRCGVGGDHRSATELSGATGRRRGPAWCMASFFTAWFSQGRTGR